MDERTLEEVAHAQSDEMYDVLALLRGAQALHPSFDDLGRLLDQAINKLAGIHDAFQPHI